MKNLTFLFVDTSHLCKPVWAPSYCTMSIFTFFRFILQWLTQDKKVGISYRQERRAENYLLVGSINSISKKADDSLVIAVNHINLEMILVSYFRRKYKQEKIGISIELFSLYFLPITYSNVYWDFILDGTSVIGKILRLGSLYFYLIIINFL